MSDHPPGTFGYECDRLEAELERQIAATSWWGRWYLRLLLRRLRAKRERLWRSIPAQLEAGGFIDAPTRARMERLQDRR